MKYTLFTLAAAAINAQETILQTAIDNNLDTLVAAASAAKLGDTLGDVNADLTVFAPTDQAFTDTVGDKLGHLLVNDTYSFNLLTEVLLTHVVAGGLESTELGASQNSLSGEVLNIALPTITTGANSADVDTPNVPALKTSVVHVIDKVLLPTDFPVDTILETAVGAGLTTLKAALETAQVDQLFQAPQENTWTVFAPTNAAFDALLAQLGIDASGLLASPKLATVLNAHVAKGAILSSKLPEIIPTLQGPIKTSDVNTSATLDVKNINGIVHLIDEVIVPTIVTAAVNNGLSTLVTAVVQADLAGLLGDLSKLFTVFAPTNEAFAAGGLTKTLEYILKDSAYAKSLLAEVLSYHVVDGQVLSTELSAGSVPTLLAGKEITVTLEGGAKVNGATVGPADLEQFNGVVHVIDQVLVPEGFPSKNIAELAIDTPTLSVLVAALTAQADYLNAVNAASDKSYTVFAPTDDAFIKLLTALGVTADQLLASPELGKVLSAHIIEEAVFSTDVPQTGNVETLYGPISVGKLKLSPTLDVRALNGVVHIVDEVIVPDNLQVTISTPNPTASPTPADDSSSSTMIQSCVLVVSAIYALMK